MSQRDLAEKIGIDPGHIARMETDKTEPRSRTKVRLAEGLGVSPLALESVPARNWKDDFLKDPRYSNETKQVIIRLVEEEERRLQRRRK